MPATASEIFTTLHPHLSPKSRILTREDDPAIFSSKLVTWSDLNHKTPSAIVLPATEQDVSTILQYAAKNSVPVAAKSGGHSKWCTTGPGGLIVDFSLFKNIIFDEEFVNKNGERVPSVRLGGGVLVQEALQAAYEHNKCLVTGTCNSVGMASFLIGGGTNSHVGLFGYGCDNILEVKIVTGSAEIVTCSDKENQELFWAVRGGGHFIGFVTEIRVRTYPLAMITTKTPGSERKIWSGLFIYQGTDATLAGKVAEACNKVAQDPVEGKFCYFEVFFCAPPDEYKPSIMVIAWYYGIQPAPLDGILKGFVSLNPLIQDFNPNPYFQANSATDPLTTPGGYKDIIGFGLISPLSSSLANEAFSLYSSFITNPANRDAISSAVIFIFTNHAYSRGLSRKADDSSGTAFSLRHVEHLGAVLAGYTKPESEENVQRWAKIFRDWLQSQNGEGEWKRPCYIGFRSGYERVEDYFDSDERIRRLRILKRRWDPLSLCVDLGAHSVAE